MINNIVTAVIINFQTPELTEYAVRSLKNFYPDLKLILIDNGSRDNSSDKLKTLVNQFNYIDFISNRKNIHHGPAMHQAILHSDTDYILFLDSDCRVLKGGFIEEMLSILKEKDSNYAIGEIIYMNKRGFPIKNKTSGFPYIRPVCMMLKRKHYLMLKPFQKHGAPCLDNMKNALENGLLLKNFDINSFIYHLGRGTASKYGYNLGIFGKLNYLLNKLKL